MKELISRVIMASDGSLHIALSDKHTLACTPRNLQDLLRDPYFFIDVKQFNSENKTTSINSDKRDLADIPGLTILKVFSYGEMICVFPKLFDALFGAYSEDIDEHINLIEYIKTTDFSDEKHFLLKFFYDLTNSQKNDYQFRHKSGLGFDVSEEILRETLNASFLRIPSKPKPSAALKEEILSEDEVLEEETTLTWKNTISLPEFAKRHGVPYPTAYAAAKAGDIRGCIKIDGHYRVNPNSPYPFKNNLYKQTNNEHSDPAFRSFLDLCQGDDFMAVQEYIKEKNILSDALRPFIRTSQELKHYQTHGYFEVKWNGKPALIVDISPDYYSKKLKKTNREIINSGNSPVDPDHDDCVFIVHHIGQLEISPFAIISEFYHRKGHHFLHPPAAGEYKPASEKDLHGPNFEIDKAGFWGRYLDEYDKAGGFNGIPKTKIPPAKED